MQQYILKMELKGSNLWREIAVSGGMNFSDLHDIIQTIFGWGNKHLHRFMVGRLEIGDYEDEDDMPINFKYEGDANIDLIFLNKKTILYEYDYGDGWQIEITVLEVKEIKKFAPPCVLKSEGGMAKDDCGGVGGLKELGEIPTNIDELNAILAYTYE